MAGAPGTNIDSKKDNIVILKFEFGETDKVSTWYFTEDQEMTERGIPTRTPSPAARPIDEDTLDVLTVCTILNQNAIDEIRIGTDFKSVISGSIPPRQEVKITKTPIRREERPLLSGMVLQSRRGLWHLRVP